MLAKIDLLTFQDLFAAAYTVYFPGSVGVMLAVFLVKLCKRQKMFVRVFMQQL